MEQTNERHKGKHVGYAERRKTAAEAIKKDGGRKTGREALRSEGVSNLGRTKKAVQRKAEMDHRKAAAPLTNRTDSENPPPVLVVVVGPKNSGKSVLIRSLVKYYTKINLGQVSGPITVIAGKTKRFTFVECPSDDLGYCQDC